MNPTRTWIVAGATLAIAGFSTAVATASDDTTAITLNDPKSASVIQPVGDKADDHGTWKTDSSPESADSPDDSPAGSADSAGSGGSADSSY